MPKTAMIAKLTAADGKRDELAAVLEKIFPTVENESGTEVYVLHEDAADPNVLWFYELYTDNDALAAHSSSDGMKEMMGALGGGLLGGKPEMYLITPRRGKGVTV
jgi:quinol monooxygenase YgiN